MNALLPGKAMNLQGTQSFQPPLSARREVAMLEFIDKLYQKVEKELHPSQPEVYQLCQKSFQNAYHINYSPTQLDIMLKMRESDFEHLEKHPLFSKTVHYIVWNASSNSALWQRHILYGIFRLIALNATSDDQMQSLNQEAMSLNRDTMYISKLFGDRKYQFFRTKVDKELYYEYLVDVANYRYQLLYMNRQPNR